jgi:tRNA pseudouridine38-40 synthase
VAGLRRSFRLVIAYDGTAFHGWQVQPQERTVQGVLEEALRAVLEGRPAAVRAAGRTDAGVHARGQVVSFATGSALPAQALPPLLNRLLPDDLRVRSAEEVAGAFDARRSALARRYAYRLLWREDLLLERFAWRPPGRVVPEALERATRVLEGEHECSAFQGAGGNPTVPVCRVYRARWRRWEAGVRLDVIADHFLYHMVRNLVGTALRAAGERDPAAAMAAVLASRDRTRGGATVPARGLCLEQVFYGGVPAAQGGNA